MADLEKLKKELKEIRDKIKSKSPKQNQSTSSSILDQDYINKIASSASAMSGSQIRDFKISPLVMDFSDHEELFANHEVRYLKNNCKFYPEDAPDPQPSKVQKQEEIFKKWVKEKSKEVSKNPLVNDHNSFDDQNPLFGDDTKRDPTFSDENSPYGDGLFEHPFVYPSKTDKPNSSNPPVPQSTTNTPDSTTESSSYNVGGMFKSIKNMFK